MQPNRFTVDWQRAEPRLLFLLFKHYGYIKKQQKQTRIKAKKRILPTKRDEQRYHGN